MAVAIPKLDDERAAAIAQSDKWTALARICSIFAAGMTTFILVPLVIWGFSTIQSSSVTLGSHSNDISTIKSDVADIKRQDGQDHDWITQLKVEIEGPGGLIEQVAKLWQRPGQPGGNRPPP